MAPVALFVAATLVATIVLITALHVAATELQKRSFYRRRD
jgi:hypothetical protein